MTMYVFCEWATYDKRIFMYISIIGAAISFGTIVKHIKSLAMSNPQIAGNSRKYQNANFEQVLSQRYTRIIRKIKIKLNNGIYMQTTIIFTNHVIFVKMKEVNHCSRFAYAYI